MKIINLGIVAVRLFAVATFCNSMSSVPLGLANGGIFDGLRVLLGFGIWSLIIPTILWIIAPIIAQFLVKGSGSQDSVSISLCYRQILVLGISLIGISMIPSVLTSLMFGHLTQSLLQLVLGISLLMGANLFVSILEKIGVNTEGGRQP